MNLLILVSVQQTLINIFVTAKSFLWHQVHLWLLRLLTVVLGQEDGGSSG